MGVADKTASFGKKIVPSDDLLGFFDVVFTTLGNFINRTDEKIHRAGGGNYDDLFNTSIFKNRLDFRIGDVDTEDDFGLGLVEKILDFFFG